MNQPMPLPEASSSRVEKLASHVYEGVWSVLANWFDVPRDPPALPITGPGGEVTAFKPSPGFLRYMKAIFWIVAIIIDLGLVACWLVILVVEWWVAILLLPPLLILAIVPDIVGYVAVHLRYDTAWYVMTDRAIRIRRGVWILHETTITFENVQNVSVRQGPLQRHFGIADVTIETAGAGAGAGKQGGSMLIANQGIIAGIDNAEAVRDVILSRLRLSKSAGLGDDRETQKPAARSGLSPGQIDLLRSIHTELQTINAA